MEFSPQYYKRREYINSLQVPTLSDTKKQLGEDMTQILQEYCPESLKEHAGFEKRLAGPGDSLWVSPSDILVGKVVLKPPLTGTHLKALTHEGILDIGEEYEAQWLAALELEKKQELVELEERMLTLAKRNRDRAVDMALRDRDKVFNETITAMNADFAILLRNELMRLEEHLRDYYQALIDKKVQSCIDMQEIKLNECVTIAVCAATEEITKKFILELQEQEIEMTSLFQARLEGQAERFREELKFQEEVFATVMRELKHNLQCNNLASLMYVLCIERRKCLYEQQAIVDTTTERITELESENVGYQDKIKELQQACDEKERQLKIRDECLLGVMMQFQKFINYALDAVPTQAEFLLSVEKMMTFELCQALVNTKKGKKSHLARLIMPWRPVSLESIEHCVPLSNQKLPIYHDCLNEHPPPKCVQEDDEVDIKKLPSVNYKNNVYIREDFRNKFEQDERFRKTIEDDELLWNKDVQNLIKLMKKSTYSSDGFYDVKSPGGTSIMSSVHFLANSGNVDEADNVGILAAKDSVIIQKSRYSKSMESRLSVVIEEEPVVGQVALLAATDSVTLTKEKHENERQSVKEKSIVPEIDESEFSRLDTISRVIEAPSTTTIQLKKPDTRSTAKISSALFQRVSDVTIKLTKPQRISSTILPTVRPSNLSRRSQYSPRGSTGGAGGVIKNQFSRMQRPQCESGGALRISQHRDSLELVSVGTRNVRTLKNIILPNDTVDPEFPTQQFVINAPSDSRTFPDVNFKQIAEVFNELYHPQKPWKIYEKKKQQLPKTPSPIKQHTNFLAQPPVAKVVGNVTHEENSSPKDFTVHRIHSILDILKKDDDLIRLFTKCQQ